MPTKKNKKKRFATKNVYKNPLLMILLCNNMLKYLMNKIICILKIHFIIKTEREISLCK